MATLIEGNNVLQTAAITVLASERVVVDILFEDNTVKTQLYDHYVPATKQLNGFVTFTGTLVAP